MTPQFLFPWWLIALLMVPMAALCLLLLVRRPRQRWSWLRRLLMVLLLAVVLVRPSTPLDGLPTQRMNANVFFVVDRTGSMNAEDYAEGAPRLDGVKADMRRIMQMTEGSRYSIIAFDSVAAQQLPLTTDAGAAEAWIDTLTTEPTAYSRGSNVDRARTTLITALQETRAEDPDSSILVYVFSDGENTDGQESEAFSPAAQFVDGGAVLGYGTAQGGRMRAQGGATDGEYITDGSGAEGRSVIDENQLKTIAGQMGVPYLHRTDPEAAIEGTMEGIELKAVPLESSTRARSFEDWYWVASIPLALLFLWELGEMTRRLPRDQQRDQQRATDSRGEGQRR
ncbi:VWA domain-containing protein [Brachybacterium sp. EF45031]|uniref:vWA domain-containing protein n=1 Tax=Brachybacterium sillae TaxID=2810536 RepID=UPI00217E2BC4|nr:VWA domain-containing protein [Brachybacterium sillae]MCS6710898.1 VWA domain-containing protein [Brachybacterium sillae]